MVKPKTHFEQIPLEVVKKITEVVKPQQTAEQARATKKKKPRADPLRAVIVHW
jgi:hypothetical protein